MKYSLSKRSIALLLSMVMVFAMLPAAKTTAVTVQQNSQVVDGNTMNSWQSFFSPTDITTAHAGGVWTDKSVFKDNSAFTGMTVGNNNFLVALSAMGSNSIVVGQDYAPTDTMFVLDVSNSMSDSALSSMVTATNNAIRTLLEGENNTNRVGVVLYGTTASVLLPLDHYTGVEIGGVETFIQMNGSSIRAAQNSVWVPAEGSGNSGSSGNWWDDFWEGIFGGGNQGNGTYETEYLTNQAGNAVTTSVSTGGGTYTQGGIWKAWQQFNGATAVSTDKVNAKRAPVMVLMCDGAATYSASDFDNVPNSATHGTGSASSTGDGFVTQLTAAFVKAKMTEKYGTDAFLYTLGLDVEDIAIAQAILDPANKTAATNIDDAWTAFLRGSATVSMYRRSQGGDYQNVTITNDTATTLQSAFTSESYKYADKYFSAGQVTDLNQQFQNIVNEISLSAGYYPTHLDDNGANYSGYITFVDELGKGMEVKEIEGIVIGDNTYTGKNLARALAAGLFGTKQEPTAMGNEFVWAVKSRLGLTDNDEIWALLDYAWSQNYLSYTAPDTATNTPDKWSNYIVWYGDANGEYLGYDEELESVAAYRNACYGMLGTPDGTHQTTDMMYVGIQVSTNLATGDQTVTFRVPAAMLPVVTYQINIDGNKVTENTTATLTYKAADPIRLVYEVGVKEEIDALNVLDYATEISGKYYLYTNKWNQVPDLTDTSANDLSYAYFEPGADNEHYYFTEDSVIYDAAGNKVTSTGDLAENGDYYYEHYIFRMNTGAAITDGKVAASADFHKEKLSADAIRAANTTKTYDAAGNRCVPKGTMHYAHSHDLYKGAADSTATSATANNTETFPYVREQIVDAHLSSQASGTSAKHYELLYLGNNGRLTVNPATGISITKQVDDTITDANATYTFDIDFSVVNVPNGTYNGVQVAGNKATVTLKAGETVYIYDLPVGAKYEITEKYGDGYKQSAAVGASGTVAANTVQGAVFTNTKRGTGSLTIEKDVTDHPFTTAEIETVLFDFVVELTKADGTPYSGDVNVIKSGDTALTKLTFANGKATFTLHDNQELTIINLPEGTTYTVTESAKTGYQLDSSTGASGETKADALQYAHFVNKYVAIELPMNGLGVEIIKNIVGTPPAAETFHFSTEVVGTSTKFNSRIQGSGSTSLTLDGWTVDTVGEYHVLVHELTPQSNKTLGMTYDAKRASFTVVVTDTNMDGQLEWSLGDVVNAEKSGNTVTATFNNIYENGSVTATFHAEKKLENNTGIEIPLTEFHFGLYSNEGCTTLAFDGSDPMNPRSTFTAGPGGLVDIKVHINRQMLSNQNSSTLVYYLKEIPGTRVGMTYDETVYKITIPVTDNSTELTVGTITVEPVADTGNSNVATEALTTAVFNNKYEVAATLPETGTVISGNKTLNGRKWGENESFEVELYETDASFTLTDNQQPKATQSVSENTPYAFNLGQYTSVGIHHYIVKEKLAGTTDKGITYDAAEYHVTVAVTRGTSTVTVNNVIMHQLVTNVTAIKLGNGVVAQTALDFKNTYHAAATDDIQLGGTKVFENATPGVPVGTTIALKKDEFRFNLEVKDAAGNVIATGSATNDVNGNFLFDKIHFTKAGVYTATITEVNGGIDYITYAQPQTVTITVADNTEGKLTASATGGYLVQMKNTYKAAETKLGLTGIKELVGAEGTNRPLQANEFSFTLKPVGAAPMPGNAASVTVKNGADSKFAFPDITFNTVGTYQYTITEEKETDGTAGIYYDKAVYTVTVEVTDHGTGKLVAKVTGIVADKGLADETTKHVIDFYNSYYAKSAEVILSGNKVLENVTPGIAAAEKNIPLTGENLTKFPFSFVLEAVTQGAPMPNQATVSSGENGAIAFGAITFDAVGEYKYTVKELIPANSTNGVLNGVTYTVQTHNITVTVTDNKLGQLVASVALEGNDKAFEADGKTARVLFFKNTFTPKDATAQITVEKDLQNLCGKPMGLDGFRFQLMDAAGNKTVLTSDAQGLAKFTLTFGAEDAGKTFVYKLTEVDTEVKGMQYSDAEYEIKIAVTGDAVTGELRTAVTITKDGKAQTQNPVFVNVYDLDEAPQTGDTSRVMEMGLCMGISGAALLAVLILGKKKRFAAE